MFLNPESDPAQILSKCPEPEEWADRHRANQPATFPNRSIGMDKGILNPIVEWDTGGNMYMMYYPKSWR